MWYQANKQQIRCSLVGQDIRLSPERPGFKSRQRNFLHFWFMNGLAQLFFFFFFLYIKMIIMIEFKSMAFAHNGCSYHQAKTPIDFWCR